MGVTVGFARCAESVGAKIRTDGNGREWMTKGDYYKAFTAYYGDVPDLEEGETWRDWFDAYFSALVEDHSAEREGNHYKVYLDE